MEYIRIKDKNFRKFISEEDISRRVSLIAKQINTDLKGKDLLFLGILNGSFMFIADLYRKIELESSISFLKLSSYLGTESTGKIKELIGLILM